MWYYSSLGKIIKFYCETKLSIDEFCQMIMMLSFETSPQTTTEQSVISRTYGIPYFRVDSNPEYMKHLNSRLKRYYLFYQTFERIQSSDTTAQLVKDMYMKADTIYFDLLRAINGFKKLIFHWKKKTKKYCYYEIDTDLHMTPLSEIKNAHCISLLENNTFYQFKIHDLLSIMKTSLLHSTYGNSTPFVMKNPYTNINFSYANLYNIYFHAIFNTHVVIHPIIHRYFESEMSLRWFIQHNELELSRLAQIGLLGSVDDDEKYQMLRDIYESYPKIVKYRKLPKELTNKDRTWILSKTENVLKNYLLMSYSDTATLKTYYGKLVEIHLRVAVSNNPLMLELHFQPRKMRKIKMDLIYLTELKQN